MLVPTGLPKAYPKKFKSWDLGLNREYCPWKVNQKLMIDFLEKKLKLIHQERAKLERRDRYYFSKCLEINNETIEMGGPDIEFTPGLID